MCEHNDTTETLLDIPGFEIVFCEECGTLLNLTQTTMEMKGREIRNMFLEIEFGIKQLRSLISDFQEQTTELLDAFKWINKR